MPAGDPDRGPVGRPVPRPDGPAKVTGQALYTADLSVPGAWWGGAVRSPVAHGRVLGIDRDPAFDWTRVVVVLPRDLPGANVVALIADDQPLLAEHATQHVGEPLALVAAPDPALLAAALRALTPRVAPLPAVLDAEASTQVLKELRIEKGDVDAVFATPGVVVVEGTWRTDSQEQMYIEPQGCVAWPPAADGSITVKGSLQCPHYVQKALCRALALAPAQVRVIQAETGGGFGGKEDYPSVVACHAAVLARACRRPVRVQYERHEDLLVTPKRHPSRVRHRTAVDRDGRLLAMDIDILLDGGAYTTLSPVVLSRGAIHAAGPYRCAHVRIQARAVATHHVPYGAFRGFGAPQTCFAVERQMDQIARQLRLHPLLVRQRNLLQLGDRTATGQLLRESVGVATALAQVVARTGFDQHLWGTPAATPGRIRRGVGLSVFCHGAGFTGAGEAHLHATVEVALRADGCAEVRTGATEIGQGTQAMLQAIAAQALGCELGDVVLAPTDTAQVPDSGPTVASRTCMIVGGCVARACAQLRARLGQDPAPFRARAARFVAAGGDPVAQVTYTPPADLRWDDASYQGDAYPVYGWAADIAQVAVDLDTFAVQVERMVTAVDVGRAIQPQLVAGQIEGGTLQAVGFAHLEVVDARDGRCRQDRMATCIIPTTLDAPPTEVFLVEAPYSGGPFGAKGVGELPMDGGAPAVAAALQDALGVVVDHVPATPERLLDLWLRAHPEEALPT